MFTVDLEFPENLESKFLEKKGFNFKLVDVHSYNSEVKNVLNEDK